MNKREFVKLTMGDCEYELIGNVYNNMEVK